MKPTRANFPRLYLAGEAGIILLLVAMISACEDDDTRVVNVDNLYWSAFRSPETFDEDLKMLPVPSRASECLRDLSDDSFELEQGRLRECGQMLTGSPAWNECHSEAEAHHNRGVIQSDIADAIDGEQRFDESEGGTYLMLSKSIVGEAEWEQLVEDVDAATPPVECEYEEDDSDALATSLAPLVLLALMACWRSRRSIRSVMPFADN